MKWLVALALSLAACDSCNDDKARHTPDSHSVDALADMPQFDASDPNSTVLITQSPPGPTNGDPTTWGGVLQFEVSGDGSALVASTGIAKTSVEDPVGLWFEPKSSVVFVGNRHGNNAADGTAGSISRFAYAFDTHALTALPEITGNGLDGVHQIALSPTTGELFAANVNNGISRFSFDAAGNAVAAGTISDGAARGVCVAPDGKRLYVSTAANVIRQFDLVTGDELTPITLQTTATLHFFAVRKGELYVAALDDNKVYRFSLDADDNPTMVQAVDASAPVGVAFSADGGEMYVTGHRTSDLLQRYLYDPGTDTWMPNGTMDLGTSLGGVVIAPG